MNFQRRPRTHQHLTFMVKNPMHLNQPVLPLVHVFFVPRERRACNLCTLPCKPVASSLDQVRLPLHTVELPSTQTVHKPGCCQAPHEKPPLLPLPDAELPIPDHAPDRTGHWIGQPHHSDDHRTLSLNGIHVPAVRIGQNGNILGRGRVQDLPGGGGAANDQGFGILDLFDLLGSHQDLPLLHIRLLTSLVRCQALGSNLPVPDCPGDLMSGLGQGRGRVFLDHQRLSPLALLSRSLRGP
mmetsp:Transcript_18229/g.40276  ORF Transcript_18229/g.40276 Transcript_18229/m.40276 type:complete len:240 (+) Transcript_18229:688-1407(+)